MTTLLVLVLVLAGLALWTLLSLLLAVGLGRVIRAAERRRNRLFRAPPGC